MREKKNRKFTRSAGRETEEGMEEALNWLVGRESMIKNEIGGAASSEGEDW